MRLENAPPCIQWEAHRKSATYGADMEASTRPLARSIGNALRSIQQDAYHIDA